GRQRQQGHPGRELGQGSRSAQFRQWRQGRQLQPRHVRELEGPQLGRAQGEDRVAQCVDLLRRPCSRRRAISQEGQQGLPRRPAGNPQVAGPVGQRSLHHRRGAAELQQLDGAARRPRRGRGRRRWLRRFSRQQRRRLRRRRFWLGRVRRRL
ncbi:MAG: Single-stranded DNA-binding protein, partial [uncultured Sphingomonas sp.]